MSYEIEGLMADPVYEILEQAARQVFADKKAEGHEEL